MAALQCWGVVVRLLIGYEIHRKRYTADSSGAWRYCSLVGGGGALPLVQTSETTLVVPLRAGYPCPLALIGANTHVLYEPLSFQLPSHYAVVA
jgi:hypothetical protein